MFEGVVVCLCVCMCVYTCTCVNVSVCASLSECVLICACGFRAIMLAVQTQSVTHGHYLYHLF